MDLDHLIRSLLWPFDCKLLDFNEINSENHIFYGNQA